MWKRTGWDLNPWPVNHKSNALPQRHHATHVFDYHNTMSNNCQRHVIIHSEQHEYTDITVTFYLTIPSSSSPPSTPLKRQKSKGFPYSIPSVRLGANPGVQAVSLQVTISHPPGGRLPLLSARPAVTFLATEHHHLLCRYQVILLGDRGT